MIYTYIRPLPEIQHSFEEYVRKHFNEVTTSIENTARPKAHWTDTDFFLLLQSLKPGDLIITYDASHLSHSFAQILEIMKNLTAGKVDVHFMKYELWLNTEECDPFSLLRLLGIIQKDFISIRTKKAVASRRALGLPIGRPKGRRNSSLKLDRFSTEIEQCLMAGMNYEDIARKIDCHPQTLAYWVSHSRALVVEGDFQKGTGAR